MDDIFTLLSFEQKSTAKDVILLMDKIANSDVFETSELIEYLDRFTVKSQSNLLQPIVEFCQSTQNVDLNLPGIEEVSLN